MENIQKFVQRVHKKKSREKIAFWSFVLSHVRSYFDLEDSDVGGYVKGDVLYLRVVDTYISQEIFFKKAALHYYLAQQIDDAWYEENTISQIRVASNLWSATTQVPDPTDHS